MDEGRRQISMFPDWGHEWPLWESTYPEKHLTEPEDYDLSPELTKRLRDWYDEWDRDFDMQVEPPAWRDGTGVGWSERGREIADQLRKEVQAFADVTYDGEPY